MASFICPDANLEPLSPTGFQLTIDKLPQISFFSQEATLPGMTLPTADVMTPLTNLSENGDMIQFNDFELAFMVDSKMGNYKEIFNWLFGVGFPSGYSDFTDNLKKYSSLLNSDDNSKTFSDGSLLIYGNDNKIIETVRFVDLHPVSLGSLSFMTTADDVKYLVASVTFDYKYFYFQ